MQDTLPLVPPEHPTSEGTCGLLRGVRPRQWVKNLLVLSAPLGADTLHGLTVLRHEAVTFLAFSFADPGYLINGVMDTDGDRAHASSKTSFCVTECYNCWSCVATRHGPRSVLGLIPDGAR